MVSAPRSSGSCCSGDGLVGPSLPGRFLLLWYLYRAPWLLLLYNLRSWTVSGARCCVRVSPRAAIVFSQGGIDTAALTAATRAPSIRGDVRNYNVDYGVVTEALETQIGTFP
eukprot:s233_g16.t1